LRAGDVLTIYDGPNTSSPIITSISAGTTTALAIVYSSGTCLTFNFTPNNNASTRPGWTAAISCVTMTPCNYMLTLNDAGCNGWGFAMMEVYVNGWSLGAAYPDPFCRMNFPITGLASGDVMESLYYIDGTTDSQNSFIILDPWGNHVAAGSLNLNGDTWVSYIIPTCVQPPASPNQDQDCSWAPTICSNAVINGNSSGAGNYYELGLANTGCLMGEHQSTWYFFQPQTSGTIAFTISPTNGTDDYDFAIWDATTCPPTTAPIRCSWAGVAGNTGLGNGAIDNSESANGDSWVAPINVIGGQDYLMLIDNWSGSSSPYDLTWNLSGGATLDCTPLPIELAKFDAICNEDSVKIEWETLTEKNNEYFVLERSLDGDHWQQVYIRHGAGSSNISMKYSYTDYSFYKNITNYYRLKQIDYDGKYTYSEKISIQCVTNNELGLYTYFENNSDYIKVVCTPNAVGIYNLTAFDNIGREIYCEKIYLDLIGKTVFFPMDKFKNGISYINLSNENSSVSKKVVIY